jgi:hypothetical protein
VCISVGGGWVLGCWRGGREWGEKTDPQQEKRRSAHVGGGRGPSSRSRPVSAICKQRLSLLFYLSRTLSAISRMRA